MEYSVENCFATLEPIDGMEIMVVKPVNGDVIWNIIYLSKTRKELRFSVICIDNRMNNYTSCSNDAILFQVSHPRDCDYLYLLNFDEAIALIKEKIREQK